MPTIFEEVKDRVSMRDAIGFLQLKATETKGSQLRFQCPACKGNDKRSLSVNLDKGYRCFASSKSGNDCIALVAHVLSISQSDAAKELKQHFLSGSSTEPRQRSPADEDTGRSETSSVEGALRPLDYLEPEHEVIEMLGLTPETMQALGAGYAPKGTMVGRICIPLRMPDGELIGYFGIATKHDMSPLLLFPKNLDARIKPPEKKDHDEMRKLLRVV